MKNCLLLSRGTPFKGKSQQREGGRRERDKPECSILKPGVIGLAGGSGYLTHAQPILDVQVACMQHAPR